MPRVGAGQVGHHHCLMRTVLGLQAIKETERAREKAQGVNVPIVKPNDLSLNPWTPTG